MDSNLAPQISTLGSPSNSSDGSLLNEDTRGSPIIYPPLRQENNQNSNNFHAHSMISQSPQEHDECNHDSRQQTIMFETVVASMNEMVELWKRNHPIWLDSSSEGRCFVHHEISKRTFPNPNRPY